MSLDAVITEAHAPRACAPQQEKPVQWETFVLQWSIPWSLQREEACAKQQRPSSVKNKYIFKRGERVFKKKKSLSFRFTAKLNVPRFPIYALPSQSLPHPIIMPHQSGTFLIKDEPTLTHHYHPQVIVYLTIHSWFVHSMSLDKHITHISIINVCTEYFHCLKNSLCSPYSSLPPPSPIWLYQHVT